MEKTGRKGVVEPKMNSGLRFFICISTSSSQKMVIPPAVISQMPSTNRVILRDRYGNIWPVKVDINGDKWSFKEGWPRFYNENRLKPLNNMFFEYKGGSTFVFDFKVLGENGCEKRGAQNFRIKEECGFEEINDNEFEKDLNKDDDYDDNDDVRDYDDSDSDDPYYDDDDGDDEREEEENAREKRRANFFEEELNRDDDDDVPEAEESMSKKSDIFKSRVGGSRPINRPSFVIRSRISRRNELFIPKKVIVDYKLKIPKRLFLVDVRGNKWRTEVKQWQNGRVCCNGGWGGLYEVNNINQGDACICELRLEQDPPCILVRRVDDIGTSRNASKRQDYKKKHDYYGVEIFSKGMATRPQNRPFFVSSSRPRRHELRIPNEVIKDYKLELTVALSLVDERGRRWETRVKQWRDGRVVCSGGWSSLCNVNGIHKDDVCICEFFLERDDPRIRVRLVDVAI